MKKKGIKRIFISFTLLSSLFAVAQAQNHDDVYDVHFKKEKVKKTAVVPPRKAVETATTDAICKREYLSLIRLETFVSFSLLSDMLSTNER